MTSHRQKHFVIIGNQMETMLRFRGSMIAALVHDGVRVTAICPPGAPDVEAALRELGATPVAVRRLKRGGLNPVLDLLFTYELWILFRRLRPDGLFAYFIKPSIFGLIAAFAARVPRRIALIEGLGFAFASDGERQSVVRMIARHMISGLFRVSLPLADAVFVLNEEDQKFIRETLPARKRDHVFRIDGIGVDLKDYTPEPSMLEPLTFTFVGRLIEEKGVRRFTDAARQVKALSPGTQFVLLGGLDDNPSALAETEVRGWVAQGLVDWPGEVPDVRPWLARTSVLVLPSLYGEGRPRSIMEAMAMARPVITSKDVAGCRESLTDGVSGFLVPISEPGALKDAMLKFVHRPELIESMGAAALCEARRRYDVNDVNRVLLDALMST